MIQMEAPDKTIISFLKLPDLPESMAGIRLIQNPINENELLLFGGCHNNNIYGYNIKTKKYHKFYTF